MPTNAQVNALKIAINRAAIIGQFEQQIQDIRQAAKDHGDALVIQSQNLIELSKSQSEDHARTEATIIMQSRIVQQGQIDESQKTVIRLEDMGAALQANLDAILGSLRSQISESTRIVIRIERTGAALQASLESVLDLLEKYETAQTAHDLKVEEHLKQQREILLQVHQSIDASLDSLTNMVTVLGNAQSAAENPRPALETESGSWLRQLATQLVTSGVSSVMTGAVIMIATRPSARSAQTSCKK